ncbi:MAG: AMP-binding protein [Terricaulis sp.]
MLGRFHGRVNAATLCCDRHCGARRPALIYEQADGQSRTISFEALRDQSSRVANVLMAHGVQPGDRVAGLLPRVPELLAIILGVWRVGAVYQPLFTAFGPKAIEQRLNQSGAKLVVTNKTYREKLCGIQTSAQIATFTEAKNQTLPEGDVDFQAEMNRAQTRFQAVPRQLDDPFLIMFTSGTTGAAKPLLAPLKAIVAFVGYMRDAVDLRPKDKFWNIADPGWAYGLYYAVTGPLAMGHATLFYDGGFTAESTVRVIKKHAITNLAGSPTAFRLVMAAGAPAVAGIKGQLRAVSSAGEPLNPEVVRWFGEHLDVAIYDHYGQTELGMVVCNHHRLRHDVHLGAAGFAVPGHRVVVVDSELRELAPGLPGTLALDRRASPLMWFKGYEGVSTSALQGNYYLSGDTVELNQDGSISFVGRADDVITSAGYRIGPFEVESALLEHPAVIEAAVVGKPDAERTEIVKAFVVLAGDTQASPALAEELQTYVRKRLSAHAYPREVEFIAALPKTPSGKIQRFLLRNQETAKIQTERQHT